jgi:hypothetical protein
MFEDGHWKVGEDGVLGGIKKFREAKSQEQSERYVIKRSW